VGIENTTPGSRRTVCTAGWLWDSDASEGDGRHGVTQSTYWIGGTNETARRRGDRQYYAVGSPSGTDTAKFTPLINVAANFNVYEWHSYRGTLTSSYAEASAVPCRIYHSGTGGYKDTTIDETKNYGQWNLLGKFPYTPSGNKTAWVTNRVASGSVTIDAFRWEFVGIPKTPDSTVIVTTRDVTGKTPTSATLNGQVIPNGLTSVGYFRYKIHSSQTFTDSTVSVNVGGGAVGVAISHPLVNLTSGETYDYQAVGTNSKGIGVGEILSFTTTLVTSGGSKILTKQP
jgi:hypothetical protein